MKKIYVVDDTKDTLEVTEQVLRMKGFDVKGFENAREPLDLLKDGAKVDLVMLDMRMPDISGIDFCEEIRKNPKTRKQKIVFFTASGDLDKKLLKKYKVLGYIFKPFNIDSLVKDVTSYCR